VRPSLQPGARTPHVDHADSEVAVVAEQALNPFGHLADGLDRRTEKEVLFGAEPANDEACEEAAPGRAFRRVRAAAECLVRAGARVVVTGRRESVGRDAAQQLRAAGGEAHFVTADAGSESDCERMVQVCLDTYGRIDGAFNNAGQDPDTRQPLVHEYSSQDWQEMLEVHLSGLFYAMKQEIPSMLEAGKGSIVNMASVYATGATPVSPPSYVSSSRRNTARSASRARRLSSTPGAESG